MTLTRLPALLALSLLGLNALPAAAQAESARVIVKYRNGDAMAVAASAQLQGVSAAASQLGVRAGVALRGKRFVAPTTQVVVADGMSSRALADQLMRQGLVEYAEPDLKAQAMATANDHMYPDQWYLKSAQFAAIRAEQAWDVTTGSSSVVVAVLDTGVRPNHPDLTGKFLPGYDFISEDPNGGFATANDFDGRDPNPEDPGDWDASVAGSRSSWHGTRVSGVLAAQTNNSIGVAGVAQQSRILPVRVLGVVGGYVSDIVAGMRWAAGLPVPGVPDNANPARVLNLSFGGQSECSQTYQSAINDINARGATIVAAAGNFTGPVLSPGNCSGLLTVAGVRHTGSKVGYSSLGPQVGISAPAGNCVNLANNQECIYRIDTTTNVGTTSPGADGYTSSTNPNGNVGTSFAAPQVSGVAALMLALNPNLQAAEVISRIKAGARGFPASDPQQPGLPVCPTVGATGSSTEGQCLCTTSTCGAGLLDASAAVGLARNPMARIAALPSSVTPGTVLTLDATSSGAMPGATVQSYAWSLSGTAGTLTSPAQSTTNLALPTAGSYTVTLTVTDSNGRTDQQQATVQAVSPAPPPASGGGGGGGAFGWVGLAGLLGAAYAARRSSRSVTAQALPPR